MLPRAIGSLPPSGVPLWTLLAEAGGIGDPANRAELRHVIRITAREG
jgi:hypothetical protein